SRLDCRCRYTDAEPAGAGPGARPMSAKIPRDDDEFAETHEINVTPFIDVMLVLLIIFMVAAPLATVDVPVNLPGSAASPAPRPDRPVFLTVQEDLSLTLGDEPVTREQLPAVLDAATGDDREEPIFLRADRQVPYGE